MVWKQGRTDPFANHIPGSPRNPPFGPGRYSRPPRGLGSLVPPRSSKRRDSDLNLIKLVKTAKCQRKVSKRPVIVPDSQNGPEKSPLDFLGFTFWPAFSPKELMGLFDA